MASELLENTIATLRVLRTSDHALSLMVKREIQMMIFCSIRINKLHQLLSVMM